MGNLLNFLLIGLCIIIAETRGDCMTDLQPNGQTFACLTNMAAAMQNLDHTDPMSICADNIKSNMLCLEKFVNKCPSMSQSGPLSSVLPQIQQFKMLCGVGGGDGGSPMGGNNNPTPGMQCPEVLACGQQAEAMANAPELQPSGKATPFSMIPVMVFSLCKMGKDQMNCLDANRDKCPDYVDQLEKAMADAIDRDKTTKFDYGKVKMIVKDECPKIDPGFPSNQCVRQKLEGNNFVSCMRGVEQMSSKAPRAEQCKFYFDGKACIEEHIGKPCGQNNAKVIVDTAYWVIHDLPEDCQKDMAPPKTVGNTGNGNKDNPNPENGNASIRASLATIFMLIVATFF